MCTPSGFLITTRVFFHSKVGIGGSWGGGPWWLCPRLVGFELQKLKSHLFKAGGARGGIFVRSCLVKMQVFGERPRRYFKNSHW